jgi:hypothetical protein
MKFYVEKMDCPSFNGHHEDPPVSSPNPLVIGGLVGGLGIGAHGGSRVRGWDRAGGGDGV